MSTDAQGEITAATESAGDLPLLAGDRSRLRGYRDGDIDDLYALFSDPAVTRLEFSRMDTTRAGRRLVAACHHQPPGGQDPVLGDSRQQ